MQLNEWAKLVFAVAARFTAQQVCVALQTLARDNKVTIYKTKSGIFCEPNAPYRNRDIVEEIIKILDKKYFANKQGAE